MSTYEFNAPVLAPNFNDFFNFGQYIDYLNTSGYYNYGTIKVKSPTNWYPYKDNYDFETTLRQNIRTIRLNIQSRQFHNGIFYQSPYRSQKSVTIDEWFNLE